MANRLIHESSPYLQQHANNPVNWYPWGTEALTRAREENKPVLLSLGYAACHWCHVMAHESFEDAETAQIMNELFVNIKVDKEERPDLDKIYQTTHYLLTEQTGGWPLTVFLGPGDLIPFFSGTYFPLADFKKILRHIADAWQQQQPAILKQNAALMEILHPPPPAITDVRLNLQPIENAQQTLQRQYDGTHGGFGGAPKFPQPTRLAFLLDTPFSSLAEETLAAMARGGIYDQVGGGFYRYAVDAAWRIPHFEKMLYDNAELLFLYVLAYKKTGNLLFADVARATANWIMTEMQAPTGGYYSSMDADSEGHEGKYYVWDKSEIAGLLSPETFALIEPLWGLDRPPNFEGRWHLFVTENIPVDQERNLQEAKQILSAARKKRQPPAIDHKILTGWNALMIKAMLIAGEVFGEKSWLDSAQRALAFQLQTLDYQKGYLDDHAFLIDALLVAGRLDEAREVSDRLLTHFTDTARGGFYFTGNDQETLFYRPKTFMDEATPAGNAIAAQCLLTLGRQLNKPRYTRAATTTLHAAWPLLTQYPDQHCALLQVLSAILT